MISLWPVVILFLLLGFRVSIKRKPLFRTQHDLQGRVVAVVGASRGIGLAIASNLLADCAGVTVVIGSRHAEMCEAYFKECRTRQKPGGNVVVEPLDLSDPFSIEHFAYRLKVHCKKSAR